MEFREWILERLTPAVMVISSQEVEEMCQEKNGLTVVDMLRPYGFLHQLSGEQLMDTCLHSRVQTNGACKKQRPWIHCRLFESKYIAVKDAMRCTENNFVHQQCLCALWESMHTGYESSECDFTMQT